VGVLSIILFVLLVLGMPLFSFLYLHQRNRSSAAFEMNESSRVTGWPKPCKRGKRCQHFRLELT
jgi:hypothetical protein